MAIKTCFSKYVDFSGRASRAEFWWFFLLCTGAVFIAALISDAVLGLVFLGLLLPLLAVGARRLHDTGNPAPLLLLYLIPYAGAVVLLILFAGRGDAEPNRFGPVP